MDRRHVLLPGGLGIRSRLYLGKVATRPRSSDTIVVPFIAVVTIVKSLVVVVIARTWCCVDDGFRAGAAVDAAEGTDGGGRVADGRTDIGHGK